VRVRRQKSLIPASVGEAVSEENLIDVRELLDRYSVEELAESADEYFARLNDWTHLLTKPYSVQEAPELLTCFGALLFGLHLSPGMTILDFGVGSGWTSWMFSQMGCRVIASDVSATALRIASERYARLPLIGVDCEAAFLRFDGRRFELDDGVVHRVVCNDCFHHVANPEEVLTEFARVLRPGGLCVMSEPGSEHSRLPQAQTEMRNFRVVERDIIVEEIASQAQAAGFESVEVALYCGFPDFVDSRLFAAAIEPSSSRPNELLSSYLKNRRLLRLRKPGVEALDSRNANGLANQLWVSVTGTRVHAVIENTGAGSWLPSGLGVGAVNLGAHLFSGDGRLIELDFMRWPLSDDVVP
jgi:2-polyprenyl-3-methyl-5-hydroxy-6-metoxy-1,4-benzoquinol methylase